MATAAFLDKYFECVDSLPLDLQRYVSRLREVELEKKELFAETERVKEELVKAVQSGSKKQCNLFRRLQECLLLVREVGNTKLEISARMLDKVEDYSQQLSLCSKDLELHPHSDDILLTPRGPGGSLHYHQHNAGESPMSNGIGEHKSSAKRSSGVKRPRQHTVSVSERDEEGSGQFVANGGGGTGGSGGGKDGGTNGGKSKEGVAGGVAGGGANTGSVAGTGTGNGKPPKKKVKTIKKKVGVSKEKDSSSSAPAHVPMPDLTSQPLDPNEPTYCLCQQVSFGEMIGCDNDDCPIEWFHFQCVGLTSKPKGKWYCPSCSQERKSKSGK